MRLASVIVTFFFIGHAKIAPGSIASLVTAFLFYLFAKHLIFYVFVIIIFGTTLLSYIAIRNYTAEFLEKDRSEIVIDEVIGQSISLLPLLFFTEDLPSLFYMCLVSFLFFRFFDISKPFPINKVDKMNNTFGIIFDDILAGILSAILLTLTLIL